MTLAQILQTVNVAGDVAGLTACLLADNLGASLAVDNMLNIPKPTDAVHQDSYESRAAWRNYLADVMEKCALALRRGPVTNQN